MFHPFFVTGTLGWSPDHDFFVETDQGERWLLDLPWSMTEQADRLLHHRVVVEGGRTGPSMISVHRIEASGGHSERISVTVH